MAFKMRGWSPFPIEDIKPEEKVDSQGRPISTIEDQPETTDLPEWKSRHIRQKSANAGKPGFDEEGNPMATGKWAGESIEEYEQRMIETYGPDWKEQEAAMIEGLKSWDK